MGDLERKHKRIRTEMPVYVIPLKEDQSSLPEEQGILYDLSAGGCAFYFDREIPIGNRVHVKIVLSSHLAKKLQKPELSARGAICRIERHAGGDFLLGVRFLK